MSSDEFHLFSTYLYLFGTKCVKSKLSIFLIFLMNPKGYTCLLFFGVNSGRKIYFHLRHVQKTECSIMHAVAEVVIKVDIVTKLHWHAKSSIMNHYLIISQIRLE
jgi:hypothetical protein